uniref:Uncharacterized protein n=1 Tax=Chromera velia CCMP2878 TaxID=1169474 RepID=A0A0G4HRT2_9ALVE|eukprot:Cvel_8159.t1-p1 / transcript=Cvel_8159.t1 / gene=Cvel_8159 / organism=Chromera_velia_CCMP2878 / gene_product=hypothetical protein / transcript_product=hypothetical protein / location=Cvel_scaffold444:41630-49748(-) / protein_length=1011 / sequence_SO=supercontig / SO=protein_coding / is_pseudo=false
MSLVKRKSTDILLVPSGRDTSILVIRDLERQVEEIGAQLRKALARAAEVLRAKRDEESKRLAVEKNVEKKIELVREEYRAQVFQLEEAQRMGMEKLRLQNRHKEEELVGRSTRMRERSEVSLRAELSSLEKSICDERSRGEERAREERAAASREEAVRREALEARQEALLQQLRAKEFHLMEAEAKREVAMAGAEQYRLEAERLRRSLESSEKERREQSERAEGEVSELKERTSRAETLLRDCGAAAQREERERVIRAADRLESIRQDLILQQEKVDADRKALEEEKASLRSLSDTKNAELESLQREKAILKKMQNLTAISVASGSPTPPQVQPLLATNPINMQDPGTSPLSLSFSSTQKAQRKHGRTGEFREGAERAEEREFYQPKPKTTPLATHTQPNTASISRPDRIASLLSGVASQVNRRKMKGDKKEENPMQQQQDDHEEVHTLSPSIDTERRQRTMSAQMLSGVPNALYPDRPTTNRRLAGPLHTGAPRPLPQRSHRDPTQVGTEPQQPDSQDLPVRSHERLENAGDAAHKGRSRLSLDALLGLQTDDVRETEELPSELFRDLMQDEEMNRKNSSRVTKRDSQVSSHKSSARQEKGSAGINLGFREEDVPRKAENHMVFRFQGAAKAASPKSTHEAPFPFPLTGGLDTTAGSSAVSASAPIGSLNIPPQEEMETSALPPRVSSNEARRTEESGVAAAPRGRAQGKQGGNKAETIKSTEKSWRNIGGQQAFHLLFDAGEDDRDQDPFSSARDPFSVPASEKKQTRQEREDSKYQNPSTTRHPVTAAPQSSPESPPEFQGLNRLGTWAEEREGGKDLIDLTQADLDTTLDEQRASDPRKPSLSSFSPSPCTARPAAKGGPQMDSERLEFEELYQKKGPRARWGGGEGKQRGKLPIEESLLNSRRSAFNKTSAARRTWEHSESEDDHEEEEEQSANGGGESAEEEEEEKDLERGGMGSGMEEDVDDEDVDVHLSADQAGALQAAIEERMKGFLDQIKGRSPEELQTVS